MIDISKGFVLEGCLRIKYKQGCLRSWQAEAKRFLGALSKKAELKGSELFAIEELFDIADILELNVPDLTAFIDQLNEAGQLSLLATSYLIPS